MKKYLLPLFVAATALFASCKNESSGSGEAVTLKLNLQSGQKYAYTMDTKMLMEQTMMGQKISVNNDMLMSYIYDVTGADGSNKKINVTYDHIKMDMKSPVGNMSYDSKDSAQQDSPMASMGRMVGKTFSMIVTEKGEIVKLEGFREMMAGMIDSTNPQAAATQAQIQSQFNDTAMRNMMQQALNFFPDGPVKPGDTWKKAMNANTPIMTMKMDNVYKLVSVKDGVAHIEVDTKITGAGDQNNAAMKDVKMDMKGDQKGTMDVEIASGLIQSSKLKQTISGNVNARGMEIPMSINSDVSITGKKL